MNLQPHHYNWILEAAHHHFVEKLHETESAIIRIQRFKGPIRNTTAMYVDTDVKERLQKLNRFRDEYLAILEYLEESGKALRNKTFEDEAPGVVAAILERHGVKKQKRAKK